MMERFNPLNRRNRNLIKPSNFVNMVDDFINDSLETGKNMFMDTFKVDVKELNHEYIVEAEVPGVKKQDIDLRLEDDRLSISVNQESKENEVEDYYIHRERRFSSMERTLYLPHAKQDGVSAKLEEGLLTVRIAKEGKPDNSLKIEIE